MNSSRRIALYHNYKILSQYEKIKQIQAGKFPVPSYATLHLSYSCNQNCRGCAYAEYNKEHFMPEKSKAFNYVNQLIDFGIKAFDISGGGEPSIIPFMPGLIEYIISRGGNYGFATNGVALSNDLKDLLALTATYIRVSLETGDKETYCKYKRCSPEMFDKVCENIIYFGNNRSPNTELSIKFDVNTILYGKKHINGSLNILNQFSVDTVSFKSLTGGSELNDERKEWISDYLDHQSENRNTKIINSIIRRYPVPQCILTPLQTTIDGKGYVYLCCYYYGNTDHIIGNLNDTDFKDIWGSEVHRKKQQAISPEYCTQFDCKFFAHHEMVKEVFKRGRLDII